MVYDRTGKQSTNHSATLYHVAKSKQTKLLEQIKMFVNIFNIFEGNRQLHPDYRQHCIQSNQEHMEMPTFYR